MPQYLIAGDATAYRRRLFTAKRVVVLLWSYASHKSLIIVLRFNAGILRYLSKDWSRYLLLSRYCCQLKLAYILWYYLWLLISLADCRHCLISCLHVLLLYRYYDKYFQVFQPTWLHFVSTFIPMQCDFWIMMMTVVYSVYCWKSHFIRSSCLYKLSEYHAVMMLCL